MSEFLTKSRARNIFYGGSLFFRGDLHRADRSKVTAMWSRHQLQACR